MRTSILLPIAVIAALPLLGAPFVTPGSVALSQNQGTRLTTISYSLEQSPAIVTVDIQTNRTMTATADESDWVSIGDEHFCDVSGDVNRLVEPGGVKSVFWRPDVTWAGERSSAVRAVVTAWSTNAPPPYMVVDLRRDATRPDPNVPRVQYFTSTNALPFGGLTNDVYRNGYMAMRLVKSQGQTFKMGSPDDEYAHANVSAEAFHFVTFTNADFYMAVFPTTRGQVMNFGTEYKGDPYGLIDIKLPNGTVLYQYLSCIGNSNNVPANLYSYVNLRGAADGFSWPINGHAVSDSSLLGLMRARTGVDFDLPTEAQWEFACRAGTTSASYNYSGALTADNVRTVIGEIAWVDFNSLVDGTRYLPRTGLKKPNDWGFYDMCGSLYELCLDYYVDDLGVEHVYEPVGPVSGEQRVTRGGCYLFSSSYSRSASRHRTGDSSMTQSTGARFVCPACLKWPHAAE